MNGKSVSDPKYPDVRWSYQVRDDRLFVERTTGGRTESLALDYALGSGKHGVTFVAIQGEKTELDPSGIEHRLSYFANSPRLAITPGQEGSPRVRTMVTQPKASRLDARWVRTDSQACFGCHATLTSTRRSKPARDRDLDS